MYNQERKQQFITDRKHAGKEVKSFESLFKLTSSVEEHYKLDLAELSPSEIIEIYRKSKIINVRAAGNALSKIRQYQKWCISQEISTEVTALAVKPEDICAVNFTWIKSPKDLAERLDRELRPDKDFTIDILIKLNYWCAFAGIPRDQRELLKTEDVMLEPCIVHYEKNYYTFPRQAKKVLELSVRMSTFNRQFGVDKKLTAFKRKDSPYLFRSIRCDHLDVEPIQTGLRKEKRLQSLTYNDVYNSGIYYRIYIDGLSDDKKDINFRAIARSELSKKYKKRTDVMHFLDEYQASIEEGYKKWYTHFYE